MRAAGFVPLQTVQQKFSNRDFLTQGLELSRTIWGWSSFPNTAAVPAATIVSRQVTGYSIDNLSSLTSAGINGCAPPASAGRSDFMDAVVVQRGRFQVVRLG